MDTIVVRTVMDGKAEKLLEQVDTGFLGYEYDNPKISRYKGLSYTGYFRGVKFIVEKKEFREKLPTLKLTMNSWRIKTYADLVEWIYLFVGKDKELLNYVISEMRLFRIDFCFDVWAPKGVLGPNLYRPGAVVSQRFRSNNETFYLGSGEDVICCYEKLNLGEEQSELVAMHTDNSCNTKFELQRIERRLQGRKLPIQHIDEFSDLADFEAFSNCKWLVLNLEKVEMLPHGKKDEILKYRADYGVHQLRKKLNTSRHFSRNYSSCFEDYSSLIRTGWKNKMDKYLT